MEDSRLLKAALTYAQRNWAVFPLHTPVEGGCSCRRESCANVGKHPRTQNGWKDATTAPADLRRWWGMWPEANIGIACGPSGLAVIDVDPRHGGDEAWRDIVERFGDGLTETVVALTGSGGAHYYYSAAGQHITNSAGALGPGVDVRGDGGYVVAPPSVHASGEEYAWERSAATYALAPFPDVMVPRPVRSAAPMVGDTIPDGQRDETLTSLAGTMRRRGMGEASILAALIEENKRCVPPLGRSDLERIARSVARYEPGRDIPVRATGLTGYARLRKQDTKPPVYIVDVGGRDVRVTAAILVNHHALRTAVMEQADILVSAMKGGEWDATLAQLTETIETLPAPEDASEEGLLWDYIAQSLANADTAEERFDEGSPVRVEDQVYTNGRQIRGFLMLRNLKADQRRTWEVVEAHGGIKKNALVNHKQKWVWAVPVEAVDE